ncbi:MAG: hypothetical protein CMB46_03055 [Euryarchaeota archaeon]|nr:hypothetical protein [Euryarchaeota archaeon]|tara:strand:+ start:3254 stop:3829 length:576 start_codon:yes stop_codon:yes gene_type:complete
MGNPGHRLGASGTNLENTIEGLRRSLDVSSDPKFKYWEFDIRESSDGVLFVFHDDTIDSGDSKFETSRMKFAKIFEAGMELGIRIPTFKEVILELEDREESVMVEIKHILTDGARREVIDSLSSRERWKVMATPERFEKIFPPETREEWEKAFGIAGVELVRVGRHRVDLFKSSKSPIRWFLARRKWLFGL